MGNDLVKLHKELGARKQTDDIKQVRDEIFEKLKFKMRDNFIELLEIGGVVGYDHLKVEVKNAIELLDSIK